MGVKKRKAIFWKRQGNRDVSARYEYKDTGPALSDTKVLGDECWISSGKGQMRMTGGERDGISNAAGELKSLVALSLVSQRMVPRTESVPNHVYFWPGLTTPKMMARMMATMMTMRTQMRRHHHFFRLALLAFSTAPPSSVFPCTTLS